MQIEYQALRSAFLATYATVVSEWGGRYDHHEAEAAFKEFLNDMARGFSDAWHRRLVS